MPLITRPDYAAALSVGVVKQTTAAGYNADKVASTAKMFSSESLSDADRVVFEATSNTIGEAIDQMFSHEALREIGIDMADASMAKHVALGKQAASMIAKIGSLKEYGAAVGSKAAPAGVKVFSAESMGVTGIGSFSAESYDGQIVNNSLYYSIMFNFSMVRQEELCEAFFPTILLDPLESAITVELNITSYMQEFVHALDGSTSDDKIGKAMVIKNIFSEKWLMSNSNKAVPVYRDESKDHFLANHSIRDASGNEEVTTAPLLADMKHNLLGMSATPLMLSRGVMDQSDYLDRSAKLTKLYVQVDGKDAAGNALTEIIPFDATIYPNSNFMPPMLDNVRTLNLNFATKDLLLTGSSKTSKGAVSTILSELLVNSSVKLSAKLTGDLDLQTGSCEVNPTKVQLSEVRDGANNVLPSTDSEYKRIAAGIIKVSIIAYDIDAFRTNSNLRTKGKLLTSDVIRRAYQVPFLTATTVMGPEVNIGGDQNNLNTLADLCVNTGAKQSMYGIKQLFNTADQLDQVTNGGNVNDVELTGIGSFYVYPFFKHDHIDVNESVDSLSSSDRREDIAAVIINKLRDGVISMLLDSNYLVAFQTLRVNEKIHVIIGTDIRTKMYLTNGKGNEIALTDDVVAHVYASANPMMKNNMFMTFATTDGAKDNKLDPFNFGNTIWSPTMAIDVKKQTNGANNRELSNIPRFVHIVNLPIMYKFTFSDFGQALGKNTKQVKVIGTVNAETKDVTIIP